MAPELLCGRCEETLCPLDYVVLAEVPPSQVHLAVDFRRPDAESHAEGTLRKIPNDATGRKGADRCPYHLHCRSCESDVGKITKVADRQLFCFKTERVRFKIGGRKLDVAKKLKNVKDRLLSCGVCAVEVAPTPSCCERNESDLFPLIYGDVTGIREEDVDLLTRHTPRDYQLEIFKQALSGNSLVCLPTGSGKTLVAAMVISCMTSINPGKFAVFVVDKVPLAHQQYDYLKKQVPRLELKVITGEPELKDEQKDRRSEDEDWTAGKVDVLVLTHQILLNMLTSQSVRMSDISVLVIDEAHHCCKNHPYKKIMEMYKDTADELKPLVLALTASPVDERTKERSIEKLEELLSNLCVPSLLLGRGLDWTHPEVACEPVPLTSQQRLLKAHVEVYVKALSQQVENFAHSPGTLQGIDVFSTNFRGAMWKLLDQHHGLKFKKAQALGEHTIQVVTSNEISNILGLEFALQSLNDCFSRLEFASTPMERTKKAIVAIPERRLGNADVYNGYSNLRDFVRRSVSHREGAFSNPSSGRFRQLKREIDKFVSRVKEGKSSRGIVFVKMRKTAYDLCEQLKKVPGLNEALRPTYFVGHGQGSDGMDWKAEQQEVLRKFRFGKIKLLISTNVLEEGIDVPVCNLVIRFDSDLTLRSLVQGRGRASRRADSKFVIICEEEETKKFRDVMAMERDMEEAAATVHRRRGSPPDQAFLWGCERKRPDLSRLRAARGALRPPHNQGVSEAEKYTPRIKVTVHNVATDEDRMKVTRFFHDHFEVSSLIPRREVRKMHFDLEARAGDGKEHRSKEDFYNLVTETWCSTLSPPEAEPDRFWLQRNEPYSGKKSKTPVLLLPARCLSIGYFVHQTHFCRQWPETNCLRRVNASFEHDLRIFTVNFTAPTRENGHQRYKAEIFYSELEDFLLIDRGKHLEKSADLFISLRRPPRLFRQVNGGGVEDGESDSDDSAFEDSSSDSEYETDEEFPDEQAHGHESGHPEIPAESATWERVPRVGESSGDWGECLVYHLVLDPGTWVRVSKLLGSLGRFDKKVQFAAVKVQQRRLPAVRLPPGLPFDVHYSVRCLVSSHPVVRARISGLFGHLLASNPDKAVTAIEKLNRLLERDKFCDPETELIRLMNQTTLKPSGPSSQLLPSHCAAVKRLVITPTRTLFYPAEVMCDNRVLRNYDSSRFLCVNVRDEDFSQLSSAAGTIGPVLQRLKDILDQGLDVSGRAFRYLGSSNSQLRNHGCWFVEQELRPNEIRRWMGDFSSIRCVASFVARMGQCFSTSMDAVGIEIGIEAYEEPDVRTPDGQYRFSDGVGTISPALSGEIVRRIGKDFIPSAYQIRFAGYKGVLTEDPRLEGLRVCFRESMHKFDSQHRRLEVLQTSRPQVVYLNHQVIMLLSNLGVPDGVFLKLQAAALDCLAEMLVSERRAVQQMTSAARTGISYVGLSEGGLPLTVEPFFKSLLVAVYRERFHNLLSRARIQLPPKEARLMMGVMDETGVLEQGQVFVQYSAVSDDPEKDFNKSDKRVLTGRVVVGRNPCLHPGDFRTLTAVDSPQLRHLVDCVVFPQKGTRPHPNEMAGGDLDGDLYFVCWYKGLLPTKPDCPPMQYDALEAMQERGEITVHHMTKHFVDYIRFDQLGVIDNAHKALADQLEDGMESEECLQLAECHSHAVDAPKTGKWPRVPRNCSVKKFPDFMMKADKPAYPSEKVLGQLYQKCRAFHEKSTEVIKPGSARKPPLDPDLLVEGYASFNEDAEENHREYREQIETLMNLYGVETEAELMTGSFLKLRNRLGKEKNEVSQILAQLLRQIRLKFRAEFFKEFGLDATRRKPEEVMTSPEMQRKASAWYFVAYNCEPGADQSSTHVRRLLGFPWLVDDVILGIRRGQQPTKLAPRSPVHVAAQIGQSLAAFHEDQKAPLLDDYKVRVRAKERLSQPLRASFFGHTVSMVGPSATLLSQKDSPLDLCVLPSYLLEREAVNPDYQHQRWLLDNTISIVEQMFESHTLKDRSTSPVLVCTKPCEAFVQLGYPKRLVLEMTASWQYLMNTTLVSSYIRMYPDLLPLLRLVHRLGHLATCSHEESTIHSNALVLLMLVFCAAKRTIRSPSLEEVRARCMKVANGKVTDGGTLREWENVISFLDRQSPGPDYSTLGEVLLSFLQSYGDVLTDPFPEPIASILGVDNAAALLTEEQRRLSREHVLHAFHFLALHSDVKVVLALCGSEVHRVVFLSDALSCTMRGLERSHAKRLSRQSGAKVTIRPKPSAISFRLILEARGSAAAQATVEREVERLSIRAARDRVSLMSLCFVQGASLMLFEGSHSDDDHVTLEPYWGANHQTHDYLKPHVPILKRSPPAGELSSSRNFRLFKRKFLTQLAAVEQDLVPAIHGELEFAVHFGRVYVFSVPKSFIWDPRPVTVAMLKSNLRRRTREQALRQSPRTRGVQFHDPDDASRRRRAPRKRRPQPKEDKKKKKKEKPCRSSFFTVVHSTEKAARFLRRWGFRKVPEEGREKYSVTFTKDNQFCTQLDGKLAFHELTFPSLRWCVTDVRRKYHENPQDESADGIEVDVRFLLQSRRSLSLEEISGTEYEKYQEPLEPSAGRHPFAVKDYVWKDVSIIRHMKTAVFRRPRTPLPSFLSNMAVCSSEVTEYSRPTSQQSEFKTQFRRHEVKFQPKLPDDCSDKEAMESFLRDIWDFAFEFSSFMYQC